MGVGGVFPPSSLTSLLMIFLDILYLHYQYFERIMIRSKCESHELAFEVIVFIHLISECGYGSVTIDELLESEPPDISENQQVPHKNHYYTRKTLA